MAVPIIFPVLFAIGFQLRQAVLKERMKQRLEAGCMVSLILPADDLHWMEEGKELVINGELFDIKTIAYNRSLGTVYITGLYDKDEKVLYEELARITQEDMKDEPGVSFLIKSIDLLIGSGIAFTIPGPGNTSTSLPFSNYCVEALSLVYLSVPTPPPLA